MKKTRYALCGLSTRAIYHFVRPILGQNWNDGPNFNDRAELVGILDIDRVRVTTFLKKIGITVPYYDAKAIRQMLKETKPDVLLVAGPDYTHCDQIVAGLEGGCDVIVEKPMVINCEQVRRVQAAEKRTGNRVRVAFNYRYTPAHQILKRMIQAGKLGKIINVEFTYNLDAWHGSSYFYRWNRDRKLSGGLNIHKCCHHFDLINWFLDDAPAEVFAFGKLSYYGPKGLLRPRNRQGKPYSPTEEKRRCPIFQKYYADQITPEQNDIRTGWDKFVLPYDTQYPPDKSRYIYDKEIQIEDNYNAVVRYQNGAAMSYSCNFCTPWEGYILGINGTAGRAELVKRSDSNPTGKTNAAAPMSSIDYYPLFGSKQIIDVPNVAGGHGGADFVIQRDLFGGVSKTSKELKLVAGSQDGASSVAIGEAVMRSIQTGKPIAIDRLMAGRVKR